MNFLRLRDLWEDAYKTQVEFAILLNMNRNVCYRYEKASREIPAWAAIKPADYNGTTTDYILGRSNKR